MAIANALAFLLYLCCGALLIRNFVHSSSPRAPLPVNLLIIITLIFHGADIYFTMEKAGGWDLSLFSTLSISAWIMALITLVAGTRFPKAHPGIIVYPLIAFILMFQSSLDPKQGGPLSNPALEWHILLSLTAYSLFTLAAIQAIILAIQERRLRQHRLTPLLHRLPPLQTMEHALFQFIYTGFAFLTTGLFTGFLFVNDLFAQHLIHKTILSLISWLVFAILLWGRHQYGWRGKTAIKWTMTGFVFLVLAYLGSKLVLEFILAN